MKRLILGSLVTLALVAAASHAQRVLVLQPGDAKPSGNAITADDT